MPWGDDQGQNKYLRKASETWERGSKVEGLKCLGTTDVQNTWNRICCRNCLIGFADLLSRCFLKLSKSAKTNPINVDINTIFLKITLWRNRCILRLLKYLKQTVDERPIIQTCILEKCIVAAKLLSKWQSYYLLTFRIKTAPSSNTEWAWRSDVWFHVA